LIGRNDYIEHNKNNIVLTPENFSLSQNYPNPFNPTTNISFTLPIDSYVKLSIYDSYGRLVSKLIDQRKTAGYYEAPFDAKDYSSGVYYYKLEVSGNKSFVDMKKMILVK
jgi:hypothetical protein